MVELQDIIMDIIKYHKKTNALPSVDFVTRAYEKTSSESPLRSYCTRAILYIQSIHPEGVQVDGWDSTEVARLFDEVSGFSSAYVISQRIHGSRDPRADPMCCYHAHGPEDICSI